MNKIQSVCYRVIKETANSAKCLVDVRRFSVAPIIIVLIIQREGCNIKFNSLSELGQYKQVIIAQ
ncbi:gamma-glutamyltranspeptidase 1-like [Vespula squamosa]|uniref:Gamma-glutamyltranspeptidase 1-like n=1 Tax=Vespula squamosa TaxID=30214 RepID=A0ABD2ATB0_VESSQ